MRHENIPSLLEASQAERLVDVLSRAHQNKPHFRYIEPDEQGRIRLVSTLFREAIGTALNEGTIQLTHNLHGCALWMGPRSPLAIVPTMQAHLASIANELSSRQLSRALRVGMRLDDVHRHLVRGPHFYFLSLGVEPSVQQDQGPTLLASLLRLASVGGVPCYVETFDEADISFYMRCGFRIAGCGRVGASGPEFWAMIRDPRPVR